MANHKKETLSYTVSIEPIKDIDEAVLELFCRVLSRDKYNLEQLPPAVVRNSGGEFDYLQKGAE